jgi:hypothetical protein
MFDYFDIRIIFGPASHGRILPRPHQPVLAPVSPLLSPLLEQFAFLDLLNCKQLAARGLSSDVLQ